LGDRTSTDRLIDGDGPQSETIPAIVFERFVRLSIEALVAQGAQGLGNLDESLESSFDDALEFLLATLFT
jgi:hypothetical protein